MPLALWAATLCFSLGALIITLGVAIFRTDSSQRLNRVAALMLSFAGLGALQVGLELAALSTGAPPPGTTELGRYVVLVWQFFFPALLLFVLIFPQETSWLRRIPSVEVVVFLPYIFHLGLAILAERSGGTFFLSGDHLPALGVPLLRTLRLILRLVYDAHIFLFSLVNLGYVIATLALLTARRRQVRSPRLRDQLRAITLGLGFCLVLYSVADPVPNIFNVQGISGTLRGGLLVLALTVGSGSIAYAIVRHKFLEAGFILRRSILFLLPALLMVMAYLAVMSLARPLLAQWGRFDTRLIEPLILLLAISMLQPIVVRLEDAVEGYLQRDRREGRTVLQNLSRDIITILDLQRLAERLVASVAESLVVCRCALLDRGATAGGFKLLAAYDTERRAFLTAEPGPGQSDLARCVAALPPGSLGPDPLLVRDLLDAGRESEWEPGRLEEFRATAERLQVELLVPVCHGGEVLGVMVLGRKLTGGRFRREDLALLSTLANQTGAAMRNAGLYSESVRRAALEEELNLARQIQFTYLPSRFPSWENVEVFGLNQPSRQVGGDYFDVVDLDHSFLAAIADVAGKGVPAALVMSMIQASLRTQAAEDRPVGEMLERINRLMLQSGVEGKFATFFLGRMNLATLELSYSNAGHNPPLLCRADGRIESLDEGGLLLGVFPEPMLVEGRVRLEPGDRLVLYTDGLSEARNPEGDFFGEEGLREALVRADRNLSAKDLAEYLHLTVRRFAANDELEDDMTLVTVCVPVLFPARHAAPRRARDLSGVRA